MTKEPQEIYAATWERHLKENRPATYRKLLQNGSLSAMAADIGQQALATFLSLTKTGTPPLQAQHQVDREFLTPPAESDAPDLLAMPYGT